MDTPIPEDLVAALNAWAANSDLTPDEAATAVRKLLLPPGEVWIIESRDLRLFETTYRIRGQSLHTVMVISQSGITPLEWQMPFHTDGSICEGECPCSDAETLHISVGQRLTQGAWTWNGLPTGLVGVHAT